MTYVSWRLKHVIFALVLLLIALVQLAYMYMYLKLLTLTALNQYDVWLSSYTLLQMLHCESSACQICPSFRLPVMVSCWCTQTHVEEINSRLIYEIPLPWKSKQLPKSKKNTSLTRNANKIKVKINKL